MNVQMRINTTDHHRGRDIAGQGWQGGAGHRVLLVRGVMAAPAGTADKTATGLFQQAPHRSRRPAGALENEHLMLGRLFIT